MHIYIYIYIGALPARAAPDDLPGPLLARRPIMNVNNSNNSNNDNSKLLPSLQIMIIIMVIMILLVTMVIKLIRVQALCPPASRARSRRAGRRIPGPKSMV